MAKKKGFFGRKEKGKETVKVPKADKKKKEKVEPEAKAAVKEKSEPLAKGRTNFLKEAAKPKPRPENAPPKDEVNAEFPSPRRS